MVRSEATVGDLQAGQYTVRSYLPSGECRTAQVTVGEGQPASVDITSAESPHEWLAWQKLLGTTKAKKKPENESRGDFSFSSSFDLTPMQTVWIRIWSPATGLHTPGGVCQVFEDSASWRVENEAYRVFSTDYDNEEAHCLFKLDTNFSEPGYRVIQVGGEELPWRVILLPPTLERLEILMRPSNSGHALNAGIAVKIVSVDLETEALSHYLLSGDVTMVTELADGVISQAEAALAQKHSNPYGALVGAYSLLLSGDLDRMHDWAERFANWMNWLPDTSVIHAWQILLDDDISDKSLARSRLLEAAARGIPVFRQGLRYLVDGLAQFHDLAEEDQRKDEEVDRMLRFVRTYANVVDWNQRFTTFYGGTPFSPSRIPVKGLVENSLTKTDIWK
jgi:hypothetical protein